MFEQATDIVTQTFSQCDFPLVPAGRYRDCAPVVVAPMRVSPPAHLIARTARQRVHKAKSGAAFIFMTFAALAGTPSYELTASALARVNSFIRPAQDIREATLSPQLLSLADGYIKGQEELVTLATKHWYDFFDWVPFFPGHTCPKGSTCRELEDRPRPTTNGTHPPCASDGSPRVHDTDGTGVYSPNYRARRELKTRTAAMAANDWTHCVDCELRLASKTGYVAAA